MTLDDGDTEGDELGDGVCEGVADDVGSRDRERVGVGVGDAPEAARAIMSKPMMSARPLLRVTESF